MQSLGNALNQLVWYSFVHNYDNYTNTDTFYLGVPWYILFIHLGLFFACSGYVIYRIARKNGTN